MFVPAGTRVLLPFVPHVGDAVSCASTQMQARLLAQHAIMHLCGDNGPGVITFDWVAGVGVFELYTD